MLRTIEYADIDHERPPIPQPTAAQRDALQAGTLLCLACGDAAVLLRGSAPACADHINLTALELRAARVEAISREDKRGRQ